LLCLIPMVSLGASADSIRNIFPKDRTKDQTARLYFMLGRYYADDNFDSSDYYFKSAANLSGVTEDDTAFLYATTAKAVMNVHDDHRVAKNYFQTALQAAYRFKIVDMKSYLLTELGTIANEDKEQYTALAYYKRAMTIEQERNRPDRQAMLYARFGNTFNLLNDFVNAIDALANGLRIADSLGNHHNVIVCNGELAVIFSKQKKFAEAFKYVHKLDSLTTLWNYPYDRISNKITSGILHKNAGNYSKAIAIYNEVLLDTFLNEYGRASVYHNTAVAQALNKQFKDAEANFTAAEKLNQKFNDPRFAIQNNMEWAKAKMLEQDYDDALRYALQGEEVVKESKASAEEYKDIAALLVSVYKARGETGKALGYATLYATLQDSIFKEQASRNLADAEVRLNILEKDNQVAALSKENQLQRLRTQKNTIISVSLLVMLCLGGVFTFLTIRAYRKTLKQNEQLKQQGEIISAQVEQLAAASTMKSRFFANVSHELRTPVTILTGMLELLKDKLIAKKEKEQLSIAFSNSRKLQQMIEEILDLSRLESGKPQIKKTVVNIRPLTQRLVYAFETLMQQRTITYSYRDELDDDVLVMLDEAKYEIILNNLLYNAIKFNKAGGAIEVGLKLLGTGQVSITVRDNGCGISAKDLPHVFDRFYQGEVSAKTASPGAGIGLSLVRELTILHGGGVTVSSIEGIETVFAITLPVLSTGSDAVNVEKAIYSTVDQSDEILEAADGALTVIPETPLVWDKQGSSPRILIVEDNEEMRYYLRDVLEGIGIVAEAGNGIEAIQLLEQQIPDLIISDMMMPGMDGREFITKVKTNRDWSRVPVVMLTALVTKEDQISMLAMGVDDYIMKPFNATELRIRVTNLLRNEVVRRQWVATATLTTDNQGEDAATIIFLVFFVVCGYCFYP
jgi:signal transduction histidine kinase/AmiR/NasT family two-component response regulator